MQYRAGAGAGAETGEKGEPEPKFRLRNTALVFRVYRYSKRVDGLYICNMFHFLNAVLFILCTPLGIWAEQSLERKLVFVDQYV